MQIIKVFTYEIPFLKRKSFEPIMAILDSCTGLKFIRRKEMIAIRKILIIRAANQAMAFSIPTLAAVLSFVTYGSTQDNLDPVGVL
jgi:ATP-binding cassette subfamily C (CFTR/MRP) protein 1